MWCGLSHWSKAANIFSYADDIVLLAPSVTSLKKLINLVEIFSDDFSINFNPDKSFIILYSKVLKVENVNIFIKGQKVQILTEGKHLGFSMISSSQSSQLYDVNPVLNDMCVKVNVLKSSFRCLDIDSKE